MEENSRSSLAHAQLAVGEVGLALTRLGDVLQQGVRDDNEGVRGEIAAILERAAHRVRTGGIAGFLDHVRSS